VLSELGASLPALAVRARIAISMGDFGSALKFLREVLPNWRPPRPGRMRATEAVLNAALAAGKLGIWPEAHTFFLDGKARATELGAEIWALGFAADAGYAAWRAGKGSEALNHFGEVIAALEQRPLSAEDRYIRRAMGHLLFSGRGFDLPEDDQSLGICSRIDIDDEERVVPSGQLWFAMYFLSLKVGDDTWHRRAEEACRNSRFAVVRLQPHWNDAAQSAEKGPYANVLERVLEHARDRMIIKAREGLRLHLFDEDPGLEEGQVSEELVVAEVEPALVASLLSMRVDNIAMDPVFSAWRLTGATAGRRISEAVATVTETASASQAALLAILYEAPNSEFERACAAALVSADFSEEPAIALLSHALLLLYLSSSHFGLAAGRERADEAVRRYWRQATMASFRLHNPRITIPQLKSALSGNLSALLLAANDAVTNPLPQQLLAALAALDSQQSQDVPQAES
jgi:hypothetical protein